MPQRQHSLEFQASDVATLVAEAQALIQGSWYRQTRLGRLCFWLVTVLWVVDEFVVFINQGAFRWRGASLVCTYFVVQLARTWVPPPPRAIETLLTILASQPHLLEETSLILSLMARMPDTSYRSVVGACNKVTAELIQHLPLISPSTGEELGPVERRYLRTWAEDGSDEQKIVALLVLASTHDVELAPLAKRLATYDPVAQVREAATDFLRALSER